MKRLVVLMLMIGVLIGIAVQPAQALTPGMAVMSTTPMSQAAMATMPDCTESMAKDATHKPCKCGMAGCIAMMAAGAPFMLGDAPPAFATPLASERQDGLAVVATLRGRSTAPEPEPPSS